MELVKNHGLLRISIMKPVNILNGEFENEVVDNGILNDKIMKVCE